MAPDQTFGNITGNTTITATKDGLNVIQMNGSITLVKKQLTLDAGRHAGVAFLVNVTGDLSCGTCRLMLKGIVLTENTPTPSLRVRLR